MLLLVVVGAAIAAASGALGSGDEPSPKRERGGLPEWSAVDEALRTGKQAAAVSSEVLAQARNLCAHGLPWRVECVLDYATSPDAEAGLQVEAACALAEALAGLAGAGSRDEAALLAYLDRLVGYADTRVAKSEAELTKRGKAAVELLRASGYPGLALVCSKFLRRRGVEFASRSIEQEGTEQEPVDSRGVRALLFSPEGMAGAIDAALKSPENMRLVTAWAAARKALTARATTVSAEDLGRAVLHLPSPCWSDLMPLYDSDMQAVHVLLDKHLQSRSLLWLAPPEQEEEGSRAWRLRALNPRGGDSLTTSAHRLTARLAGKDEALLHDTLTHLMWMEESVARRLVQGVKWSTFLETATRIDVPELDMRVWQLGVHLGLPVDRAPFGSSPDTLTNQLDALGRSVRVDAAIAAHGHIGSTKPSAISAGQSGVAITIGDVAQTSLADGFSPLMALAPLKERQAGSQYLSDPQSSYLQKSRRLLHYYEPSVTRLPALNCCDKHR